MNCYGTDKRLEKEIRIRKIQLKRVEDRLTFHFRQLSELIDDLSNCEGEGKCQFLSNEIEKTNNIIISYKNDWYWLKNEIKHLEREGF